mmetsp:Transcript_99487/g.197143  ORF Transcript_99487/g.197143 Transcript_99487/m.197143 type:complete len:408 (+) Transcript_99487:50-1273(+)
MDCYGGHDRLSQLRSKALESHGADTVWYFRKGLYFLSNFHELRQPYYVTVHDPETGESDGILYPTSEQAYMAAKTFKLDIRRRISQMQTAAEAKKYCRSHEFKQRYQRPDFWDLCVHFMGDILRQKFADPQLKKMLLETGDAYLMEGNSWGDEFWGKVVNSSGCLVGKNNLGKILMDLRSQLRCDVATQARHQEEATHFIPQPANFPCLGQSQVVNSPVLVQGEAFLSPAESSGQEAAGQSASVALRQHRAQSEGSKMPAGLKPEQLVQEMAATTTRRRRWNRGTTLSNDSKSEVICALVDASSNGHTETVSAQLVAPLHDDGFRSPHGKQLLEEIPGSRSPVVTDNEVRRLLKVLREINELEVKREAVAKAGGHLRRNQMQKLAKKQEYLDKLHELDISASVSRGN